MLIILYNEKKKIIFLLSLILIYPIIIIAQQSYYSEIYNPNQTYCSGFNILLDNTNFICVGISSANNNKKIIALKLDNNGLLDTFLNFGKQGYNYYPGASGSFIKTFDGGYAIGGGVENSQRDIGVLIKYDSNLNLSWKKFYGDTLSTTYTYLTIDQCKQTIDSGFILVGEIDASGQYNTDILLIKTDSLGNKKWQRTYNFKGADRGWNVIQTPDKGFLLGAGGYIATLKHSYDGLIIKTDGLGNEKWRKSIGSSSYDDYFCNVAISPDGNFVVGLATGVGIINPDHSYRKIRLLKISPNGTVIWDKMYGKAEGRNAMNQVIILDDGSIVSTGFIDPDSLQIGDSWGWILKTNTNGDSLWLRDYYYFNGHANANKLYGIKQTKDGGFIACGQVDSLVAVPKSILVLKVDSFGCDSPGCHHTGFREIEMSYQELVVYPNPSSYEINIDFDGFTKGETIEIFIYNSVGALIKQEKSSKNSHTKTIKINDLSSGIYYYRITSNSKFYSGKFVKI